MDVKKTMIELKNPTENFNGQLDELEEWISELEDRSLKIIQFQEEKKEYKK